MLKDGLVLIWELDMNLVPTLVYIRCLIDVTNPTGDQNTRAEMPNKQYPTFFTFSFCKLGLQNWFEILDSQEIEKIAKIFMSHLVDNK